MSDKSFQKFDRRLSPKIQRQRVSVGTKIGGVSAERVDSGLVTEFRGQTESAIIINQICTVKKQRRMAIVKNGTHLILILPWS